MTKKIQYLTDVLDLWDRFSGTADFKSNEYDKELLVTLKKELGFDPDCDIRNELKLNNTTPEQLLAALLKAMKPFSVMLNDLLKMFEDANAQYTDDNVQIKFDFEDTNANFIFDINHFRVYSEKVLKVVGYELQLENSDPWNDFIQPLDNVLMALVGRSMAYPREYPLGSNDIRSWLDKYHNRNINWPDFFPVSPKCGNERIDKIIAAIWQVPEVACRIYNKCYIPSLGRWGSLHEKSKEEKSTFYQAESDYWIGSFMEKICHLVYIIGTLRVEGKDCIPIIDDISNRLEEFRDQLPITSLESELMVKQFLDILNLPIWKKRYALYSAWVATQIISAFEKCDVRYNVLDGVLSFSFGGSVIAHINQSPFDYTLIAELRTPFEDVKGHGRVHSIQPDYSLCLGETSDPLNTILVIECKQYKKPDKRNFTEAIIDYAGGRPNAQIMLVNYSSIPKTFLSGLSTEILDRLPFFNALTPGEDSCNSFKKAVKEALPKEYRVSLTWNEEPLDLDLFLKITEQHGKTTVVNYSNMGKMGQFPFARLNNDARMGYGFECIQVFALQSVKYDFYVHNYSGENTTGNIEIGITLGNNTDIVLRSKMNLDRAYLWHVFSIVRSSINVVNHMIPYKKSAESDCAVHP